MCQKAETPSWFKVLGMGILAWMGMVVFIDLCVYLSSEGSCDFHMLRQMFPVVAILCVGPAGLMVADYLRPLGRNHY